MIFAKLMTLPGQTSAVRRRESARTWRAIADVLKAGDIETAAAAVEQLVEASGREATRKLLAKRVRASAFAPQHAPMVPATGAPPHKDIHP